MRVIAIWFVVALAVGVVAKYVATWSVGCVMLGVLVALPLAGLFITIDDDMSGGFSNPDGKTPPPWHHREFWGELVIRASLAATGFAVDYGWFTSEAVVAWAVVGVGTSVGALMMRGRGMTT